MRRRADLSGSLRGIAYMIAAGALVNTNDSVAKWLTADYPVGEIMCVRGLFILIPVTLFAGRFGGWNALRVRRPAGQLLRAVMQTASAAFFIAGLGFLPLADNIALTLAGPLFITALASPLLGERVGWRRWIAVGVGFAGIVLMFRPTGEAMRWAALLPVGAALAGAFRDIVTRRISTTESSISMLFHSTVFITLAGLSTALFGWRPLTVADVGLMALSGFLLGGAQYLMIEAFRHAEAAVVAPFRYFQMVWGVLLGFVVFGDLPDRWLVGGAALVIASGLYILHREARQ